MKTKSKRLHIIAFACAVALALVLTGPALAATWSDDFSAGLRPAYWSIIQTTPNFYSVDASHANVQLAKTEAHNPGGVQYIFVRVNLSLFGGPITGDFSTQIDFANAVVPGPGLDQVELHTYYQDNSLFYAVYDRYPGYYNAHVWDGGAVLGVLPVAGDSGTFRISRTGSTVTGYFDDFPLFSEVRATALTAVDFVLQNNNNSDDSISVTFDNFALTAGSVPPLLSIAASGSSRVQLSWTTNSVGYVLEESLSLTSLFWGEVTNAPAVVDALFVLTLDSGNTQRFFRLHKH